MSNVLEWQKSQDPNGAPPGGALRGLQQPQHRRRQQYQQNNQVRIKTEPNSMDSSSWMSHEASNKPGSCVAHPARKMFKQEPETRNNASDSSSSGRTSTSPLSESIPPVDGDHLLLNLVENRFQALHNGQLQNRGINSRVPCDKNGNDLLMIAPTVATNGVSNAKLCYRPTNGNPLRSLNGESDGTSLRCSSIKSSMPTESRTNPSLGCSTTPMRTLKLEQTRDEEVLECRRLGAIGCSSSRRKNRTISKESPLMAKRCRIDANSLAELALQ